MGRGGRAWGWSGPVGAGEALAAAAADAAEARAKRADISMAIDRAGGGLHPADRSGDQGAAGSGPRLLRAVDAVPHHRHHDRRSWSTDLSAPSKTVGIDTRDGEFNDWTYSIGVTLAGMLHVADVTGDKSFEQYTYKNFDFIFDHLEYFRAQAKAFGPQPYGYRRLLDMHELDDCGAIGAALIKTYKRTKDPALQAGHRPRRRLHLEQDAADGRRHAVAPAPAPGVGVGRRPVHERSVSRADG